MTKLINKNKLDRFTDKLWERISKSFVNKTKDNILSGKIILQNGYIDGVVYSINNPNNISPSNGNGTYSGTDSKVIQANQHITSIMVLSLIHI